MPNRTLYVSDEDEAIWKAAQEAGDVGSLSKVVTTALAEYVNSRRPASDEDLLADAEERVADRDLVARMSDLIGRHGAKDASWAFGRALMREGALRSRGAVDANKTRGPQGRKDIAKKASATKGVEGRSKSARGAAATRRVQAKRTSQ
jgi:hypothetical protein